MGDLVLGLDPGFTGNNPTAIVLLEMDKDKSVLHEHYTFTPDIEEDWQIRLVSIGQWLNTYLTDQNTMGTPIGLLAYEIPFSGPNRAVGLMLAHIGGVVVTLSWLHDVDFICVRPAQAKLALAGRGNALKDQMMTAAENKWGAGLCKDEADASGVALAGWLIKHDLPLS